MKNTGKPYEELTQAVFTRLLEQAKLCTNVERDVTLDGRSTKHQIDVTFEFRAGPVGYRTIVQCKDWNSAVKQEQVLAFHSVLSDVPGQPRGIIVSRSGFQAGARTVAEHHGIKLYELREPRDEDWEGLIRGVDITMVARLPRFDQVQLIPDERGVRAEMKRLSLDTFTLKESWRPSPTVFNESSGETYDLNKILNSLVPKEGNGPEKVRHAFPTGAIIEPSNSAMPRVPIAAIEAVITVVEHRQEIQVRVDHLIAYCFKDVLDGKVLFLGEDGGTIQRAGHV